MGIEIKAVRMLDTMLTCTFESRSIPQIFFVEEDFVVIILVSEQK